MAWDLGFVRLARTHLTSDTRALKVNCMDLTCAESRRKKRGHRGLLFG